MAKGQHIWLQACIGIQQLILALMASEDIQQGSRPYLTLQLILGGRALSNSFRHLVTVSPVTKSQFFLYLSEILGFLKKKKIR
jgi:hypothetical protein